MKSVHVLLCSLCLISSGLAKPTAPILAYQDSLGQYSFGYSAPGSARSEIRTLNGEIRGTYSYIDDAGIIQSTQYTADGENGFLVAANSLPQAPLPVQNTQNVFVARIGQHSVQEVEQKQSKIGENNVFLKGLLTSEKKVSELDGKMKLQTNEREGVIQDAKEIGKNEEKEKLNNTSKVEPSVRSSENTNTFKVPSHQIIPGLLKQTSIPVFRISQGNILIDPFSIQESINIQGSSTIPASVANLTTAEKITKEIEKTDTNGLPASIKTQDKLQAQEKLTNLPEAAATPLNVLPPDTVYSTLVRYTHTPILRYVVYTNA